MDGLLSQGLRLLDQTLALYERIGSSNAGRVRKILSEADTRPH
jgi:hypothetical protein